jgi:hypothetical protein
MTLFRKCASKTVVTTLCVVLAMAFVQMSTASLVNSIQHSFAPEHHHDIGGLQLAADDHHDDDHADQGEGDDLLADAAGDDNARGDQPTHSHHHADGPNGSLVMTSADVITLSIRRSPSLAVSEAPVSGLGTHGPERPPKPLTLQA